jgi:hypothetical protein
MLKSAQTTPKYDPGEYNKQMYFFTSFPLREGRRVLPDYPAETVVT